MENIYKTENNVWPRFHSAKGNKFAKGIYSEWFCFLPRIGKATHRKLRFLLLPSNG